MKRIALLGTVLVFAAACGAKQTKKPTIDDDLMNEEGAADMDAEPTDIAPEEGGGSRPEPTTVESDGTTGQTDPDPPPQEDP